MSSFKIILLIALTIGITWLIVWIDLQFKKAQKTNPEAIKERGFFRVLVYVLLNL